MTNKSKYAQKYLVENNCLFETYPRKNGIVKRKLCNLAPEIVCEVTVDDGAVTTTYVRLRGVHESGRTLPELEIPAADLANMGKVKTVYLKELTDAYAQVDSLLSDILKARRWK